MTTKIACVELKYPTEHRHIISVGVGYNSPPERRSVDLIRAQLAAGETFYTVSPSSRNVALVYPFDCACGYKTIKSAADAEIDNNLDYLTACPWAV